MAQTMQRPWMVKGDHFANDRLTWVWDAKAVERLRAALEGVYEVSWDLETTGLNEHSSKAKIVMISLTFRPRGSENVDTWLIPLFHPESPWLGQWRSLARRIFGWLQGKYLMAHNGKFDCRWAFKHTGVDLSLYLMWDSALSEHLFDENLSRRLKLAAERTFGVTRWDDFDLGYEGAALDVPLFDLGWYAARDTYWTWMLAMNHRERMFQLPDAEEPYDEDEIEDARLGRVMSMVSMPTARTMTSVEQRGILLDTEWVKDKIEQDQSTARDTKKFLVERYDSPWDDASFAPTSHWFRDWAVKAVDAGDLRIAALTKTGKPQWSKSVLGKQARLGSEVAQKLLEHRGATKRLEFLRSWLDFQRDDGAIHAQYNVGSLITGRLSSSEPNMQQITKSLRPAFIPRPGYVMVDFDYSQIEMRVAAFIARCLPMIEAFKRGDDLHRLIAARIASKSPEHVTDDERQGGKAGNFGFLFGQTAYGFKFYAEDVYGVVFDDAGAQEMYDAFFSQWEGMAEWHAKTLRDAHRTGQIVSPLGRVRRLPALFSMNDGAVRHAENAAINAPVQGFASDIMQIAASLIEGTFSLTRPGIEGVLPVATVHDSLVAEVREDRWQELVPQCIEVMTKGVLPILRMMDVEFDVPLVVEAKIGTRWGLADLGEME